jgi:activator of HSP90 ATPase
LTGEAYVNRRKGKIICGYELELKMAYEADVDGTRVTGNVHFPYIADENVGEAHECKVLSSSDSPQDEKAKQHIRKHLVPVLNRGIAVFEKELAAGGPGGEGEAPPAQKRETENASENESDVAHRKVSTTTTTDVTPGKTHQRSDKTAPLSKTKHTIQLTERFYCRPLDICDALLNGARVMHFSRSPANVQPEIGHEFSMFDGNISGVLLEYVPGSLIKQKWRFRNWEPGHHSLVTITFREPEPGNCFVDLRQEDVPETDAYGNESVMDTTEIGWKEQIFDRIRQSFGYGA